jgi:putative ABC transport system permease protein
MLFNYLKMAWKVLARRKFFTFVSLFGISFTLTTLMIVVASFDHFMAPSYPETRLDRTLVLERMKMSGEKSNWYSGPGFKFADRYARDLPGVERMSIYTRPSEASTFQDGRKVVLRTRFTDAEYWRILEFEFLEGAPYTAADDENANRVAVIDEGTRLRLFDGEPALGRPVELDGVEYRVIGVVRDVPIYRVNSEGDVWLPLHNQTAAGFYDRLLSGCVAMFLLEPGADKKQVQGAFRERLTRVEFDDPERFNTIAGLPMTQLENAAAVSQEPGETALRRWILIWVLGVLAFMALPAINLVNINLSRIYERASEIGVRKAFGASGRDLVLQFVMENVVLSVLGGLIGLAATLFLFKIATLFPQLPYYEFRLSWRIFAAALALGTIFGLLSGVWPAWKMSRQHPVLALRGGAS